MSEAELHEAGRPRIQSVARALAILVDVAREEDGLTVREIAARQGLRLPTTYHLVHTLISEGFLMRADGRRLRLGRHAATLGAAFDWQSTPMLTLGPAMRALAETTGETAYVAAWHDGGPELLGTARGRHAITVSSLALGRTADPHARASGKLLMANLPETSWRAYVDRHPLERRTPRTLTTLDDLAREFETIRRQGYATDIEEYQLGVCCIAAPIDGGRSPFAIALSAPKERFFERFDVYRDAILEAARAAAAPSD